MHLAGWIPNAFALVTALVQAGLVFILFKRSKGSSFPVFLSYNVFAVLAGLTLLSANVAQMGVDYFYLFWTLNALLMLLEFGVMYEAFAQALKPYDGLIDLGKMLFRWAGVFLLLAAGLTALATVDSESAKCVAAVSLLERGLRLMQCGFLLLFFFFERRLGLSWRSHSVCVSLGLGVAAATELSLSYLSVQFVSWGSTLDVLSYLQYLAVVGFWCVCFFLREPQRKNVLDSPARLIFQRWNEALLATAFSSPQAHSGIASGGGDSFIPSVERAVERVMARKMTR